MGFNTTLILIVLGVYLLFMIYLGFFFKDRTNTFNDFIVGGSGIPWFVLAMTMLATLANAQQTLGIAGTSYGLGLSPMIWYFIIVNMIIFPMISRLGGRYRQMNFETVVDLADVRYNRSGRVTILLAIWEVAWGIVSTAICFFGGAIVIETVFDVNMWVAILITGAITVFYCMMGGLKAVVFTDTIQWLIILFGTAILVPCVFSKFGSFSAFMSSVLGNTGYELSETAVNVWPGFADLFSVPTFAGVTPIVLIAMGLAGSLWIPIDLGFMQRMLSAKTPKEGRKASLGFLVIVTLWACIMVAMGLYGSQLFPGVENTDTVIIRVANAAMPGLGVAIFVAAIAAAVMSTVSTYLNAAAAILTKNVYKRFIKKDATDKQMIKFCRYMIIVVAVLALAFAPVVRNGGVFGTAITAQMVLCASVAPMILLSTYWKRMTEAAAFWGCLVSGVVTLTIVLAAGGGNAVFYGAGFFGVPAIFIGLAVGFIIYIIMSLVSPYKPEKMGAEFREIFEGTKKVEKQKPTDLIIIGIVAVLLLIAILTKKPGKNWPALSGPGAVFTDLFFWVVAVCITVISVYILVRTIKWVTGLKKEQAAEDAAAKATVEAVPEVEAVEAAPEAEVAAEETEAAAEAVEEAVAEEPQAEEVKAEE